MPRRMYAASPADYFMDPTSGLPEAGVVAQVFNTITGGSPVTDLLDAGGTPATSVTSDSFGGLRFFGPDDYDAELWVAAPGGTLRYKVEPVDVASRLGALEDQFAGWSSGVDLAELAAVTELVIRYDTVTASWPRRAVALPGVPRTVPVAWHGPEPPPIDSPETGEWASDGYDWLRPTQGTL